jgi:hypothetical protein
MFLNYLKRRKRITREAFAQRLWDFCTGASEQFCGDFKVALAMMQRELSQDQQAQLLREVTIINLWAISNILRADRDLLNSLHRLAVSGHRSHSYRQGRKVETLSPSQTELLERYQKYYAAWDFGSGDPPFALASMMLDHMLNHGQADPESLNAALLHLVQMHMLDIMDAVMELRKNSDIVS